MPSVPRQRMQMRASPPSRSRQTKIALLLERLGDASPGLAVADSGRNGPGQSQCMARVAPPHRRQQKFDLFEAEGACIVPTQARLGDEVGDGVGEVDAWPSRAAASSASGGQGLGR